MSNIICETKNSNSSTSTLENDKSDISNSSYGSNNTTTTTATVIGLQWIGERHSFKWRYVESANVQNFTEKLLSNNTAPSSVQGRSFRPRGRADNGLSGHWIGTSRGSVNTHRRSANGSGPFGPCCHDCDVIRDSADYVAQRESSFYPAFTSPGGNTDLVVGHLYNGNVVVVVVKFEFARGFEPVTSSTSSEENFNSKF